MRKYKWLQNHISKMIILSNSFLSSFVTKNSTQERKWPKQPLFILKILILIFNVLKFETLSPKLHHLTINPKSRLANPRVKTHVYPLIKLILVIFFIDSYVCDKNLKKTILENFSKLKSLI